MNVLGAFRWIGLLSFVSLAVACSDEKGTGPSSPKDKGQDLEECLQEGKLCTWAGSGEPGFNGDGLALTESMLYWPIDLTFLSDGTVYVVDWNNHAVRTVTPEQEFQTVIGSGFIGDGPPDLSDAKPPGADGQILDLNHPTQVLELPSGKVLLVSWHNHKLREYDPETGLVVVTVGAGAGYSGDGDAARGARLNQPTQAILSDDGSLFILDMRNQVIRKIDTDGVIHTVAGTPTEAGYDGDGGDPLRAHFRFPSGPNPPPGGALALDDEGRLYVSDTLNHVIRRIDFKKNTIETVVGTGEAGDSGDGGDAQEAQLNNPRDLQFSRDGLLYIADEKNHRVREFDPKSGEIRTVAGTGVAGYEGDSKAPDQSLLNRPAGLAFDAEGVLYIADSYNHRIRCFRPESRN